MKKILALGFFFLSISPLFSQKVDSLRGDQNLLNLNFEKKSSGKILPDGWFNFSMIKGYHSRTDSQTVHGGKYSLLLASDSGATHPQYGMVAYSLPALHWGKELEIKAYLKLQDVEGSGGLLARIDDKDKILDFKTMVKNGLKGNKDWGEYSLKLKIPSKTQTLFFGPLLMGKGKIWIDDIHILMDEKEIQSSTLVKQNKEKEKNMGLGDNLVQSRTILLKDAKIYLEVYGTGEPMILLHGNSQSIFSFAKQIPEFSKTYKVYAIDTRGQGKSEDYSTGSLNYDLFADDLKSVMDSLGLKNVSLLGWSDGGNIGLTLSIKHPEYIGKLAIMDANLFPTTEAVQPRVLKEVSETLVKLENRLDKDSKMKARIYKMLLKEPQLSFASLEKLKLPVLVMAGEHDIILEKHTRAIAGSLPNATLWIIKGATHYAPVEKPVEFNKMVLNFFETVMSLN